MRWRGHRSFHTQCSASAATRTPDPFRAVVGLGASPACRTLAEIFQRLFYSVGRTASDLHMDSNYCEQLTTTTTADQL